MAQPPEKDTTGLLSETNPTNTNPSNTNPSNINTTLAPSLSATSATLLLVAECVGTGVLALPYFCFTLHRGLGLAYLAALYFMNIVAARVLNATADRVEQELELTNRVRDLVTLAKHVRRMPGNTSSSSLPLITKVFYSVNLFLVLGTYLMTMSKGLSTAFNASPSILYTLGSLAAMAVLTALLQTLSQLGRAPTYVSILTVLVVLVACLLPIGSSNIEPLPDIPAYILVPSSLSGISFAVGSQKLLLNVRCEMESPKDANKALVHALSAFCLVYFLVVLLAPPSPPPLLLAAITNPFLRAIAGVALVIHVGVSYMINAQAIVSLIRASTKTELKWAYVSLPVCVSVFVFIQAVPFFQDLTALIGSLTSIPLTILLPILLGFGAKVKDLEERGGLRRPAIAVFGCNILATLTGVFATVAKIAMDWKAAT